METIAPPQPTKPATLLTEVGKLLKRRMAIRQLAETLSTLRLEKQAGLNRRLVRKLQDGTLGEKDDEQEPEKEPDRVIVGDQETINYHLHESRSVANGKLSRLLLPVILASTLGLGGVGAGVFLSQPEKEPLPVSEEQDLPAVEDTNTQYDLQFVAD